MGATAGALPAVGLLFEVQHDYDPVISTTGYKKNWA